MTAYMPFYGHDYYDATADLSAAESGLYNAMLWLSWRRSDHALPGDMDELRNMLGRCMRLHGRTFNHYVPNLLKRFFVLNADGNWTQKRVLEEVAKAAEKFAAKVMPTAKRGEPESKRPLDSNDFNKLMALVESKLERIEVEVKTQVATLSGKDSSTHKERKEQPTAAGCKNYEQIVFSHGVEVLGPKSQGLIALLVRACKRDWSMALRNIELAAEKHDPRAYIAAVIKTYENQARRDAGEVVWTPFYS